jgi:hypothetical protein
MWNMENLYGNHLASWINLINIIWHKCWHVIMYVYCDLKCYFWCYMWHCDENMLLFLVLCGIRYMMFKLILKINVIMNWKIYMKIYNQNIIVYFICEMKLISCLYILCKTITKSNEIVKLLINQTKVYYIWIYGLYRNIYDF